MPTITDEQREASRLYKEGHPASVCSCGHTGDGANSGHAGIFPCAGHGHCLIPGCSCGKFRWERFREPYMVKVGIHP